MGRSRIARTLPWQPKLFYEEPNKLKIELSEETISIDDWPGNLVAEIPGETLRGADFSGKDWSLVSFYEDDLEQASFSSANVFIVEFCHCNLRSSIFNQAMISGANFVNSILDESQFIMSSFYESKLTNSKFRRVDFSESRFEYVDFRGADLSDADLSGCILLCCKGLDGAIGLETANASGLLMDRVTLIRNIQDIPEAFLLNTGMTHLEIDCYRKLSMNHPMRNTSCFIAYAEADKAFVRKLKLDLELRNVTCWTFEDCLRSGRLWRNQISDAIRNHDKVLVVCSRAAVLRPNLVQEIFQAIQEQDKTGTDKLFPIMIDDYVLSDEMMARAREQVRCGEWLENWVGIIREIQMLDFRNWDLDEETYEKQRDKLVVDLTL